MDDLLEHVRWIVVEHRHDRDGGYDTIRAIQFFWHTLEPCRQLALKGVLLGGVVRRERNVWSLALEVLVQEHARDVAPELLSGVKAGHHDPEWRDDVVLAVLRLGYAGEVEYCRQYVEKRLVARPPGEVSLVAALVRISPGVGIDVASRYLAEAKHRHLKAGIEPWAAIFVRHYLAVDERHLAELIHAMHRNDPEAAGWFAEALERYLAKPWMVRRLGSERVFALRSEITAAAREQ